MSKHTQPVHHQFQLHMHHRSKKTNCRSNPGNQARRHYLHTIALDLMLRCIMLLPRTMPWWARLLQDVPYHSAKHERQHVAARGKHGPPTSIADIACR